MRYLLRSFSCSQVNKNIIIVKAYFIVTVQPFSSPPSSLKKRAYNNADMLISAASTAGGAAAAVATRNPTGFYPVYSRMFSWDISKAQSGYKRHKTGLEDGKRKFDLSTFFAHIGFATSFILSPFINRYLKNHLPIKHIPMANIAAGGLQGIATIMLGRMLQNKLRNSKKDKAFYIQKEISEHVDKQYEAFLNERKGTSSKQIQQSDTDKIYNNIFNPVAIQAAIDRGLNKFEAHHKTPLQNVAKKKFKFGLPRLNLQNMITTALSGGLLWLGRHGKDADGLPIGNSLMQMAAANRLTTSLYQMFYEPIFIDKNRDFTKDFSSLNAGRLKSDLVTISIIGIGKKMIDWSQRFIKDGQMNLSGHALSMGTAAIAGSLIEHLAVPNLKKALDSKKQKASETGRYIKNILSDRIDYIHKLKGATTEMIKESLLIPKKDLPNSAFYARH